MQGTGVKYGVIALQEMHFTKNIQSFGAYVVVKGVGDDESGIPKEVLQ